MSGLAHDKVEFSAYARAAAYRAYTGLQFGSSKRPARPTPRSGLGRMEGVTTSSAVADAYIVLWLRPGAPLAVVKAAYRTLAARQHPDVGGDLLAMTRLNQAYATLCHHLGN